MIIGVIAMVLLLVALFIKQYRAKWFFWFMMIYAILSLPSFPVGTVVGVICLFYITQRREEFMGQARGAGEVPGRKGGAGRAVLWIVGLLAVFAACFLVFALWVLPEIESRRLWSEIEDEALRGETTLDSSQGEVTSSETEAGSLNQPLSALDGVMVSMMNTPNGSVFLNLGKLGEDENYLCLDPVSGGVRVRYPVYNTSRHSLRQAKHVSKLKAVAGAFRLPIEVAAEKEGDGTVRGADYVFTVSGPAEEVSKLVRKVITETFGIGNSDLCRFRYMNMPSLWRSKPGEEPRRVLADSFVEEFERGTRVYLGESNGDVYLRPKSMPLRLPMPWDEELWYVRASELQPAFLDRLRKAQTNLKTEPE